MNRAIWLSEKLDSLHDGMAKMWVWMFTVVVMALFAIVFNELHARGQISTDAADALAMSLELVLVAALVGFGTYVASMLFGLIGWRIEERESS